MPDQEEPRVSTSPLGTHRSAERLATRTGLRVKASDIDDLAAAGVLVPVGEYKGFPIFRLNDLDRVTLEQIVEVVERRQAWRASSRSVAGACESLGWDRADFERIVAERGITAGAFGRYALTDLEALAEDPELVEQLAADRPLTIDQAAARLAILRRDFDYCLAAGWIEPSEFRRVAAGRTKGATVETPMFRAVDVDALLEVYGVDWDQVRATAPANVSPLAELTRIPIERAGAIRWFCEELADFYGIKVSATWRADGDIWEIEWTRDRYDEPTVEDVERAVQTHEARAYWTDIELRSS